MEKSNCIQGEVGSKNSLSCSHLVYRRVPFISRLRSFFFNQSCICLQKSLMFSNLFQACACEQGFELKNGGRICEDVDECQKLGSQPCSQTCINTKGSYSCTCHPGYLLEPDGHTCKATGKLEPGIYPKLWLESFEVLEHPGIPMQIFPCRS